MRTELFALLDEEANDRSTHRACVIAVTRAQKQFSSFFKQAASEDDFFSRLSLVTDKINDIVREACVEEGSTDLEFVAKVLAGELARTSEVLRDDVKDEDIAPSDGEDGIMHVRGEAGRKLLGLETQFEENGGKHEAGFGRNDTWPEYEPYSDNELDRGMDEADSHRADEMRKAGICPYCMEKHDEMDHFPEEDVESDLLDGAAWAPGTGPREGKTAAPRRKPTPRYDSDTGRMFQPTKHQRRAPKAPADPNAPDLSDPMKNKNVVRTPGGEKPFGAPADPVQEAYNKRMRNAEPLPSVGAPTNKSLRELEGLAPLAPGELQADDEAAFLRAQSAQKAIVCRGCGGEGTVDPQGTVCRICQGKGSQMIEVGPNGEVQRQTPGGSPIHRVGEPGYYSKTAAGDPWAAIKEYEKDIKLLEDQLRDAGITPYTEERDAELEAQFGGDGQSIYGEDTNDMFPNGGYMSKTKTAVETGDTYTQETVDLPSANDDGLSQDPSPKMDKGTAGDENHTSQKPIDVPSVANPTEQQDVDEHADYTKALETPGVVKSINADTPLAPELYAAPNTQTFPNKDQANPVTSKWKVIG